jgi:hypothetical protein
MLRTSSFLFIFIIVGCACSAQNRGVEPTNNKLIIELNYISPVSTKLSFEGGANTITGNHTQRKPIPQFSLAVSGKVYQYLFLKTALGTSNVHHLLDVRFQGSAGSNPSTQTVFANYRAGYVYFSLLPEIRISESSQTLTFYFNTGPSYYVCTNNELYGGYVGAVFNEIEMASQLKGHSFAWDINAGVDFRYKVVGLNIGFGYTSVSPQTSLGANSNVPSLGFRQLKVGLGISYHL